MRPLLAAVSPPVSPPRHLPSAIPPIVVEALAVIGGVALAVSLLWVVAYRLFGPLDLPWSRPVRPGADPYGDVFYDRPVDE